MVYPKKKHTIIPAALSGLVAGVVVFRDGKLVTPLQYFATVYSSAEPPLRVTEQQP
jgi:hypothetical protein